MTTCRMILGVIVLAGLAACVTVGTVRAEETEEQTFQAEVRVGTFDSRAVAIAYARSEDFGRHIKELKAEREEAKAAGDEKRVEELEAEGQALQELLHKQGFGTWPVDNILERIKGEIPEIAKKAGVDVIVSRWNVVYQGSGIEFTDITNLMVNPFDPDAETLAVLEELKKHDPVPLEELEEH